MVLTVRLNLESTEIWMNIEAEENFFNWQAWKDAFMGRISAQKHWRLTHMISKRESLREEANHSQLTASVMSISGKADGRDYNYRMWAGWPPHMSQIAIFELEDLSDEYQKLVAALDSALDAHFQSRVLPGSTYEEGIRALGEGREEAALQILGSCIAEQGNKGALEQYADVVLRHNPVKSSHLQELGNCMKSWYTVLVNRSHMETFNDCGEIDLEVMANYSGRVFEQTRDFQFGDLKAVSMFYRNGPDTLVSVDAVQAMESILHFDRNEAWATDMYLLLSIAYQSRYMKSRDPLQRHLAATAMLHVGLLDCSELSLSIGYLLEKGFYFYREEKHKSRLVSLSMDYIFTFHGNGKRLGAYVERCFVRREAQDVDEKEDQLAFGIGKHAAYAIRVYETMLEYEEYGKASNRLGLLYHQGAAGVPVNISKAKNYYLRSISDASAEALCNMGVLQNDNQAEGPDVSYLEKAVDAENSTAMNNLAVAYDLGKGVNRNVEEAENLYKQAIEKDANPIAIYNLAAMYKFGDASIRNDAKSEQLMEQICSPGADTSGLYILNRQIWKFKNSGKFDPRNGHDCKIMLQEIDNCLAYLKVELSE